MQVFSGLIFCVEEAPFIFIDQNDIKKNQPCINVPCLTSESCASCNGISEIPSGCPSCSCSSATTDASCDLGPTCVPCQKSCYIACNKPRSIYVPRSQGANTARELVGWEEFIYRCTPGCNYITTGHTLSYTQSFKPNEIAQYFFTKSTIDFTGSQVQDAESCGGLLADYFGLSPYFKGSLKVNPTIQNIIFDNQVFVGLDSYLCGAYARIHAPLVYTRWDLNACQTENDNLQDCAPFPPCYMSGDTAESTCNILEALSGNYLFGDMQQPWEFGRFSPCAQTKVRLADIDLILGWSYYLNPISHFSGYLQVVAPTGNKPNSEFIFEPIIGNGKHWEAGGGISGHLVLWSKDCDQSLAMYIEGNVTHMFANTQCRSFDFCSNGPLSRYSLLKEFKLQDSGYEYTGNLINAINFTTRSADVSVSVKGDVSAKLAYRSDCWNVDVGYNFYGKTEECIKLKCQEQPDDIFYALKGTSDVCALEYMVTDTLPEEFGQLQKKLPIDSTQSTSTICSAGQTDNQEYVKPTNNNDIVVTSFSNQSGPIEAPGVILATTSAEPKFVTADDLNLESGAAGPNATHKVFALFGYSPVNFCRNYVPYIGFGGEFEVNALACNERTSLNQWGIWLKGGMAF